MYGFVLVRMPCLKVISNTLVHADPLHRIYPVLCVNFASKYVALGLQGYIYLDESLVCFWNTSRVEYLSA